MLTGSGWMLSAWLGSGRAKTDLAQGRQIRGQAAGAEALPEGARQALFGGSAGPIVESLEAAAAGEDPEDLGDLHHGVVVL